jgi:hypothetical protein
MIVPDDNDTTPRPFWDFLGALTDSMVGGRCMRPEDSMALMIAARDEMRARFRRRLKSEKGHSMHPPVLLAFSI